MNTDISFSTGGASVLASRRRYALTCQGRLVSSLAPPFLAAQKIPGDKNWGSGRILPFMKTTAYLRLVLALMLLPALGAPAQPVSSNTPAALETLPADSPYGEATVKRNIPYVSHPTTNQNFDLYLPRKHGVQPFPLVIWVHGGAWMMGNKEWDNVKYLVGHGYAIASIDYRYSPEAPFPAQIRIATRR